MLIEQNMSAQPNSFTTQGSKLLPDEAFQMSALNPKMVHIFQNSILLPKTADRFALFNNCFDLNQVVEFVKKHTHLPYVQHIPSY